MSRLGDMIKQERLRAGWSHKQLAKKSGVSEKFLVEVEAGTRIIADTAGHAHPEGPGKDLGVHRGTLRARPTASRAPEPVRAAPRPAPAPKKPAAPAEPTDAWVNALGGLMRAVPVRDAAGRDVDSRILPVQSGRIEGVVAEKVFYLVAPDDSMMGYRIRKGDRVLILPATVLVDNAVLLFQSEGLYYLRKVRSRTAAACSLQWYDYEPHSEVVPAKQLTLVGRARRVEFEI